MSYIPTTLRFKRIQSAPVYGLPWVKDCLRLVFLSGPKVLLTSQISTKCAVSMVIMCLPALIFCAILTLPALVFQSPQQNAYYYFATVLDEDPTRWIALFLTAICVLLSLALPATMDPPNDSDLF